jgi:hypothetical protein
MCGPIAAILQKKYPSFGKREWVIFAAVIGAILAGNIVNVIYNAYKFQSAAASPVTSISQVAVGPKFPALTLGMCFGSIDSDPVNGDAAYIDTDGVNVTDNNGNPLPVKYAPIDNENLYADCWLVSFPPITLSIPKGQKPAKGKNTDVKPDGYDVVITLTAWDDTIGINASRMLGTFTGLPANSETFPDDFDFYDFDNQNQIFIPGYQGFLPISVKEFTPFHSSTTTVTFPLSPFQTLADVIDVSAGGFQFRIDGRGLNKVKTVSTEDTTFGPSELFAALLSIFNISLTVFALFFPTTPLVVSQTYFRFKAPPKLDPSKPEGMRELSRPNSRGPEDESARDQQNDQQNGQYQAAKKEAIKEGKAQAKEVAKESAGDVALTLMGGDAD